MSWPPFHPENWLEEAGSNSRSPTARARCPAARVVRYRSRMHSTFMGANGWTEGQGISGIVYFQKPGADGPGA